MRLGVECGGTFTDLVLLNDDGTLRAPAKVFSTPADPSQAVMAALDQVDTDLTGLQLLHGSTIATNAVLERRGPRLGFLVTAGFSDLLYLQRHDRDRMYELQYQKPEPLVRRELVAEIPERIDASGKHVHPLDEATTVAAIRDLVSRGAEAFAVCLLHSYRNPEHELRVRALAADLAPEVPISLSHEVVPEFREYERASTTTVDAFVKPVVSQYLANLEKSVAQRGINRVTIMQSNGGTIPASLVQQRPAGTLLSGPAAGVAGAVAVGSAVGIENIVTMDMGGTSTDVSFVRHGRPGMTTEAFVGRVPIKVPMIDITTVGAGGGSIVRVDSGGMLRVGPQSAGADPGPACYGRGGTQPTATDANVIRGLIRPEQFLGGQLHLDLKQARAVLEHVGAQLDRSAEQVAEDVFRLANVSMAGAIRVVSVERGQDPRAHTLVAYGGAGPVHAAAVAEEIGINRVLVPPHAGLLSAYGLLAADFQRTFAATSVQDLQEVQPGEIAGSFETLLTGARDELQAQEVDIDDVIWDLAVDMRYRGQGFELTVPIKPNNLHGDAGDSLVEAFHGLHHERYGHTTPNRPIQVVTYRAVARIPSATHNPPRLVEQGTPPMPEQRQILVEGQAQTCPFYPRVSLHPGFTCAGPAVIEEDTATTFVPPQWTCRIDEETNLLLERSS